MTVHIPILVEPIVEALIEPFKNLPAGGEPHWIVDCTFGGGGHTEAFLQALARDPSLSRHKVLGVDRDEQAIQKGHGRFKAEIAQGRLTLIHSAFSQIEPHLEGKPVLGLMADLGFSSDQIEDPERGLSFLKEGPLDMRLDPSQGFTARRFLQQSTENEIADLIYEYGEERLSRRIASAIVRSRQEGRLPATTHELAELIVKAVPMSARYGRIHAATRTFQALRIHVNQELEELDCLLKRVILSIKAGGRVAILSFHSLEDRKVKVAFKEKESAFKALTKKPIEADESESERNPRSRSAKLRIAERIA